MQHDVEVAVIGGGCVGSSTAYNLAKLGCRSVTLFERGHLAWGATGKSSAIVNVGIWNASKPLVQMLLESIETFHDFNQKIGGKCGFTQTGWIGITGTEHENRIRKVSSLQNELGVQSSLISPSAVEQLDPGIFADDLTVAVYEPRSGYADPVDTTISFATNAEKLGAKILTGVNVTQLVADGHRITGIKTENGMVNAKKVVVAANVWSPKLLRTLGLTVPISPTRKQVCLFKPAGDTGYPRVVTDDFVNDLYMKPEGDRILVGEIETPGLPVDPDNFVETIDYDTIPKLAGKLLHRFPAMSAAVSRGGYAGPYDVSPDGHPILDEIPGYEGLYCAVGFSGHGFRFSPVTGRLMAELIMDGKTKGVDIEEFRLSRFSEGKPIVPLA
ncbi:MAG TPA: FAD-binding oxidoreductase [Candidatus Bathyarchaeia archaeon]|nr:FAD-binding oxidoreductase [Candidatus Bathyarchaeia archaeon]